MSAYTNVSLYECQLIRMSAYTNVRLYECPLTRMFAYTNVHLTNEIEQNQRITACFIVKFRSSFRFVNEQESLPLHEFRIRIRLTLKALTSVACIIQLL
jgi:hypothetical protein